MSSDVLEIQWYGPFGFIGRKEESVFTNQIGNRKGVYLWTIPFQGKYLTYYVGETGKSFAIRHSQHLESYLTGLYRVYDPDEFLKGKRVLIWGGLWKPERKNAKTRKEFVDRKEELAPKISDFVSQFRLFLAPIDHGRRIRQRIEAVIASKLLEQPDVIGEFQDDDIRYWPRRSNEKPIKVKMKFPKPIIGLSEELVV